VKHFKHEIRGKRRIHATGHRGDRGVSSVVGCRARVRRASHRGVGAVAAHRCSAATFPSPPAGAALDVAGRTTVVTYHPSAVLRRRSCRKHEPPSPISRGGSATS
jgi:hypothetical protein